MNFTNKGLPLSGQGIKDVCTDLGIAQAQVWAVLAVETRGFGFLQDRRPQILFERHIFHKLTKGKHDAGNADISNVKPGGYVGGTGEYPRLQKAMALDLDAALQSASWGVGQVMGFNFKSVGFSDVTGMVTEMVKGEDGQLLAMANFIKANSLASTLQHQDWATFARHYNGYGFEKNSYDTRLAAAHAKYKILLPDLALRTAQSALLYLGFNPGSVDGVIGRRTRAALSGFQERFGLPDTGDLDPATEKKLLDEAFNNS
ncbi:MAG: N-acetylmuramidase domain-containing protein [Methylovulum sp.]|nr:N-acetylmuramidase domain-containing protein [Methylovulum sp.]